MKPKTLVKLHKKPTEVELSLFKTMDFASLTAKQQIFITPSFISLHRQQNIQFTKPWTHRNIRHPMSPCGLEWG